MSLDVLGVIKAAVEAQDPQTATAVIESALRDAWIEGYEKAMADVQASLEKESGASLAHLADEVLCREVERRGLRVD